MVRSMNQGAAFCDRVASQLNEVLLRLDGEGEDEGIDGLTRDLALDDEPMSMTRSRQMTCKKKHRAPTSQPQDATPLINFQKSWLYANSRLPPFLPPFKVYLHTWQVFWQAAEASQAVYRRPRGNEHQQYVEADWRQGTKAMVLKSVLMDEHELIVFAIRGSKWNLVDWAINFRPAPTGPAGFLDDEGNACHSGFLQVARAMVAPVAARLRQILEQDPSRATSSLVLTGHSAGGAVASLLYAHMLSGCTSELTHLTGCFRRLHCVTFGAPPVSLLPLRTPCTARTAKSLFMSFVNEGDPVVRADKEYIYSLARLVAAPAPPALPTMSSESRFKLSRPLLTSKPAASAARKPPRPVPWPVPDATLSNAGRLVLLRERPGKPSVSEAVPIEDEQLRKVIFGDPAMHQMALYKRRIDELFVTAFTGRDHS